MYASFIEKVIPRLWELLNNKSYSKILNYESSYYHRIAKKPDNLDSFNRFFLAMEPLLIAAASNYLQDVKNNSIKISCSPNSLQAYFQNRCFKYVVILKGTYSLAHGNLLFSVLSRLHLKDKSSLCLILLDYDQNHANLITKKLKLSSVLGLKNITQNLADLYCYISILVAQSKASKIKVTFWGVPFGVTFAGYLLKKINNNVVVRYVTLKHLHSFPPQSVDINVAQYHVHNSLDYVNNNLIILDRLPFTEDQLIYQNPTVKKDIIIKQHVANINDSINSPPLVSSLCRIEKCRTREYLECINALEGVSFHLICFGKDKSLFQELKEKVQIKSISLAGWMSSLNSIIDLIDIYVDPLPHGGGFSLALAMYNKVSCIIPPRDITKSPSGLHEVSKVASNYKSDFIIDGEYTICFYDILFPQSYASVKDMMSLLCESDKLRKIYGSWCHKIGSEAFLQTTNQNLKNCFGII